MNTEDGRVTLLCHSTETPSSIPESYGLIAPSLLVAALEYESGTLHMGPAFDHQKPIEEYELCWPARRIANLDRFYQCHLMNHDTRAATWNCHSFIRALIDDTILDNKTMTPLTPSTPVRDDTITAGNYFAVGRNGIIAHSFVALDDQLTLSVAGRQRPLKIMSKMLLCELWGDEMYHIQTEKS